MKARNPSTGNLEEVYVKALDSLPVGTEVDFNGSVSDIPVGWEQTDEYDVLYTGDSSSGNITLSHNYSDYKRLEIIIVDRSSVPSVFTFFPSATHAGTDTWSNSIEIKTGDQEPGDNAFYFYVSCRLSFNNTTVTRSNNKVFQVNNGAVAISHTITYYKLVIREIRGYK